MDAIDFHSELAESFIQNYSRKKNLKKRLAIWDLLIKKILPLDGVVLDAGCGPGTISDLVLDLKNCNVVAIDGSEKMIRYCSEKHKGNPRISFSVKYIPEDLPGYPDNHFDAILSSSVIEYVDNIEENISQFLRILKRQGNLIISVPNRHSWFRKFERIDFKITGRPGYLRYSKNHFKVDQIKSLLEMNNFFVKEIHFDGNVPFISKFLKMFFGDRIAKTMIVVVAGRTP
jgi:SAM-dependent methyltransferase